MAARDANDNDERRVSYQYRGRSVEIAYPRIGAGQEQQGVALRIDGEPIHVEVTPDGVTSPAAAFMVFGSAEELAEELVRQWGTRREGRPKRSEGSRRPNR